MYKRNYRFVYILAHLSFAVLGWHSWDSTVKLWSVSIASGESVTTDRIPILELFDADTSIVSVAAMDQGGSSVLIAAGCSDGSFLVWSWNSIEGKTLINTRLLPTLDP